jgi:osmotically-inducible protein OsmY
MISALNAFRDDPLISTEDHINVTSYGFHVLLTGETTSAASRKRAAELVSHLPDVKKVYNELTTLPLSSLSSRSHDTWLTTKVKSAFLKIELPDFDPTRVKVVTERNIVYLMGLVTREEATAAAQTAAGVGGITKVVTLFEYLD